MPTAHVVHAMQRACIDERELCDVSRDQSKNSQAHRPLTNLNLVCRYSTWSELDTYLVNANGVKIDETDVQDQTLLLQVK